MLAARTPSRGPWTRSATIRATEMPVGHDRVVATVETAPEQTDLRALGRERWVRRAFTAALSLFLLLSLVGFFGVRTVHTSATGGGYDLEVRYAKITRPGLASPFDIEIRSADGWPPDGSVRLAVSADYLAMYDENGLDPDPTSATTTREAVIWEFEAPETEDTMVISLDARIEPAVQWGRDGFVQILDDDSPVVEVAFHTWVTP